MTRWIDGMRKMGAGARGNPKGGAIPAPAPGHSTGKSRAPLRRVTNARKNDSQKYFA